jgi:hypothetical protein
MRHTRRPMVLTRRRGRLLLKKAQKKAATLCGSFQPTIKTESSDLLGMEEPILAAQNLAFAIFCFRV